MDSSVFSPSELYNDGILDFVQDAEHYQRRSNQLSVIFENSDLLADYGRKMYACGTFLGFGLDGEKVILSRSNFCRGRFCPMCQWRRSRRLGLELSQTWQALLSDGYSFLHVVLTVRNVEAALLSSTLDDMQKAFRLLIRDPSLRAWRGSMRFTEVTYSEKAGTFHPHFHILVVVRKSYFHSRQYVSTASLRQLWQQYLRCDYLPQAYISKADSQAINEVAKYCVKPLELSAHDWKVERFVYESLYNALHGRRLFQAFGDIRRYRLPDPDALDDPAAELRPIADLSYDYRTRKYEILPEFTISGK